MMNMPSVIKDNCNKWFQKYINLPSHDMSCMPESLLPL